MLSRRPLDVPLWAWPTLLALDAPLVAVAWLLAFAEVRGAALAASAPLLLGLSVWLVYSADRLLDSFRLSGVRAPTLRHTFAAARRRPLAGVWLSVLALDVSLALRTLDATTLALGLLLAVGAILYLLPLHAGAGRGVLGGLLDRRWLQHLQVGLLFAAGVVLFAWRDLDANWLGPLLLFAALCALNCAFIERWERPFDDGRPTGPASGIDGSARAATPGGRALLLIVASLATFGLSGDPLAVATALGALALPVLGRRRQHLDPNLLRLLADGVLMVPLLVVSLPLW